MAIRYPPILDLKSQHEVIALSSVRTASSKTKPLAPPQTPIPLLPAERERSNAIPPDDIWASMQSRCASLFDHELNQSKPEQEWRGASWRSVTNELNQSAKTKGAAEAVMACVQIVDILEAQHRPEEAQRPPRGCAYIYPGHGGARPFLKDLLGQHRGTWDIRRSTQDNPVGKHTLNASCPTSKPIGEESSVDPMTRRERIEALEQGMERHDEERLGILARGTAPLLGVHGQPVLPVPPAEPAKESRLDRSNFKDLRRNMQNAEADLRTSMKAAEIMGSDAKDRYEYELPPPRSARQPRPVAAASKATNARSLAELRRCTAGELLHEADVLLQSGASDDQWARLASQLCAKAYEAEPKDVLRMVRALGAAACKLGVGKGSVAKQELLQAADHLVQSLTAQLHGVEIDILVEVVETMSDARVGCQSYLDMILALLLARHHRDCQILSASISLRLASALGRLATTLRLRPKGVGGASTFTNCKLMEALERRIAARLEECVPGELAGLDEYYLTRLCGETERRAIVERMADLELGFRGPTVQCLPMMATLQESIQRELGEGFAWSMPRHVRDYLERLKTHRLKEKTPWVLGQFRA